MQTEQGFRDTVTERGKERERESAIGAGGGGHCASFSIDTVLASLALTHSLYLHGFER